MRTCKTNIRKTNVPNEGSLAHPSPQQCQRKQIFFCSYIEEKNKGIDNTFLSLTAHGWDIAWAEFYKKSSRNKNKEGLLYRGIALRHATKVWSWEGAIRILLEGAEDEVRTSQVGTRLCLMHHTVDFRFCPTTGRWGPLKVSNVSIYNYGIHPSTILATSHKLWLVTFPLSFCSKRFWIYFVIFSLTHESFRSVLIYKILWVFLNTVLLFFFNLIPLRSENIFCKFYLLKSIWEWFGCLGYDLTWWMFHVHLKKLCSL